MSEGTIRFYNPFADRGSVFDEASQKSFSFTCSRSRSSATAGLLYPGQRVRYRVSSDLNGPAIFDVELVEKLSLATQALEFTPLTPDITRYIAEVDEELLEWFRLHPDALKRVHPGTFESVVASLYKNNGWAVERIGRWNERDRGVDLLAVQRPIGMKEVRLAIQCKTSKHAVSADPILKLCAVLDSMNAHAGVVATTSRFTLDARSEVYNHFWRITLYEYQEVIDLLTSRRHARLSPNNAAGAGGSAAAQQ